jgi:hypothetical protein
LSWIARFVLPVALGAGYGCAASDTPVEPYRSGYSSETEVYPYRKLRAEQNGWRVWEVASKERAACVAVKPAENTPWPDLSVARGSITGSGGFYMFAPDQEALPYFGFYGKYPHPDKTVAKVGDSSVPHVNQRDTVLSWEGQRVSFEVTTHAGAGGVYRPSRANWGNVEIRNLFKADESQATEPVDTNQRTTGTVDFSGVDEAYRMMLRCHSHITGG